MKAHLGFVQVPAREHEGGLGVELAQKDGRGGLTRNLVEVLHPDDWAAGGVGVGGFVAKNLNGHVNVLIVVTHTFFVGICWPKNSERGSGEQYENNLHSTVPFR